MSIKERLSTYHSFEPAVVNAVSEAADRQHGQSFLELAAHYGLQDGPRRLPTHGGRHSVEYLRLAPKGVYDDDHTRLLYAPMGIPADESMAMRAMRLFDADSSTPLIVVGSPSVVGNPSNRIPVRDLRDVAAGDLFPAVGPGLGALIDRYHIRTIDTLGYSYGADAAAAAAGFAADCYVDVRAGVWVESAAMYRRTVSQLVRAFAKSGDRLTEYVAQSDSPALDEARALARNDVGYFLGLARASNLAITSALAKGGFQDRAQFAMNSHPDMAVAIGWATESEVTRPFNAYTNSLLLAGIFRGSVVQMPLEGMHHAGADDINLHAAIMLQGIASATGVLPPHSDGER